jgi:hypothetical protein
MCHSAYPAYWVAPAILSTSCPCLGFTPPAMSASRSLCAPSLHAPAQHDEELTRTPSKGNQHATTMLPAQAPTQGRTNLWLAQHTQAPPGEARGRLPVRLQADLTPCAQASAQRTRRRRALPCKPASLVCVPTPSNGASVQQLGASLVALSHPCLRALLSLALAGPRCVVVRGRAAPQLALAPAPCLILARSCLPLSLHPHLALASR